MPATPAAADTAGPGTADAAAIEAARPPAPAVLPIVDVHDLDWDAVRAAVDPGAIRARMRPTVEAMEALLDRVGGPGLLFDGDRGHADDRAIRATVPLGGGAATWIVGDLHGDLLALEAILAAIDASAARDGEGAAPRIVFLGDFFDDGGFGLEVLLRVFELIVRDPARVCVITGNHDEALSYDGTRFATSVSPSDFADRLNESLAHEWVERAGKVAVRLFARTPRAVFLPDGLLVTHGGFPLVDLHARLEATGDWNDPACLGDFTWTRAHPKARRKLPNRHSRGSQFGHEDFADFCALAARMGRPVTHMVRGHDHPEERHMILRTDERHPVLTTVALSRRLEREPFGEFERTPTAARCVEGALPQVHRLQVPPAMVREVYATGPGEAASSAAGTEARP